MYVLVTGFTGVGVSKISQSLKQDVAEKNWHIISYEISEDEQVTESIDVGSFTPELVIVVTSSTPENVENSYAIVKVLKKQFPDAYKIAIANMQNFPERLPSKEIEELLGLTTYVRRQSNDT